MFVGNVQLLDASICNCLMNKYEEVFYDRNGVSEGIGVIVSKK